MPQFSAVPHYDFQLEWQGAHVAWCGFLRVTEPDGTDTLLSFRRTKLARPMGRVRKEHHLLHYMDDNEMRLLMQAIVDEAARHGIVAAHAATEAQAAKEHLRDMRRLTFGLLGNMGVKFDIPER